MDAKLEAVKYILYWGNDEMYTQQNIIIYHGSSVAIRQKKFCFDCFFYTAK